jgi:RNA polymerase sigma-70 factor (ECF subfamily)
LEATPTPEEAELVRRAQGGDRAAVEALLELHLPALEAYVRLRVGRGLGAREGVSDVVQSTCRELLERRDDFRHGGASAFRHWLHATAARKIADKHAFHNAARREAKREETPRDADPLESLLAQVATPSQEAVGQELLARLEAAFAELADDEREVVMLSRVVGLSRGDVAEAMGRSEPAVRNLLYRTMSKLAAKLDLDAE